MKRCVRHIVLWLLLVAWLGAAADGTGRLKNYDIWKDLPSKQLWNMASSFFNSNRTDSALLCYNTLVNRYYLDEQQDTMATRLAVQSMNQLGVIYTFYFIDYEKAHKYLLQAERIALNNNYTDALSAIYNNMSNLYIIDNVFTNDSKLDSRIIECLHKSFHTAIESKMPEQILSSAFNIAHLADDSAHFAVFREDIMQFLRYRLPDSVKNRESTKYLCLGVVAQNKGDYDEAMQWFNKALANLYHYNSKVREIMRFTILSNKCRLLARQELYQEVIDILNENICYGKATNNHQLQYIAFQWLSDYFRDIKNDTINGDRYELLALREKEFELNNNKLLDAEKAEFLFQIDEINAEVQELATRQRLTKTIAWTVAAFTLIVLVLLYLLWRRYRQVQEHHRQLYENNLALLAVDDERRQLLLDYAAKLDAEPAKYQSHQMEEGELSDLLHRILYVMETCNEIYDNEFSLERLAELVEARSSKYVSQVLNEHYHQSFTSVVNDYRIREACRRINDPEHYGHLTVEGIAQSVGFKSYPNFVNNFKKFTGLTPSAYRKQSKPQSPADDALSHADGADVI